MPVSHRHHTIHIDRLPQDVYEFVTTPANAVGTHPQTEAIRGISGPANHVGDAWVEVIRTPGAAPFEARWTVIDVVPGHTWVIATDQFGDPGITCEITHLVTPSNDGTTFSRYMLTSYRDGTAPSPETDAHRNDLASHTTYMRRVKAVLEV